MTRDSLRTLIELKNIHCPESMEVVLMLDIAHNVATVTENCWSLLGSAPPTDGTTMDFIAQVINRIDRRRVLKHIEDVAQGRNEDVPLNFRMDGDHSQFMVEMILKKIKLDDDHVLKGLLRFTPVTGQGSNNRGYEYKDPLTGTFNRTYFNYHITTRTSSLAEGEKCALIYLDLDNFKEINDRYGHHFGDEVLKVFFRRLQSIFSKQVLVGRPGGDEALIFISEFEDFDALNRRMDEFYEEQKNPLVVGGHSLNISASAGIALCPEHGSNLDAIMVAVDAALKMAKESGRNRYCYYDSHYHQEMVKRAEIYQCLNRAIDAQEFHLMYQPLFDLRRRRVYGAEALIRWDSANYGPVPPSVFIPMAEESELILAIGDWVLENSFSQLKLWKHNIADDFVLSVNISPAQIRKENFVSNIGKLIEQNKIKPQWIQLEVTETVFIDNYQNVRRKLEQLRELGLRVALDDFGTGYSSLNHIRNLSLDAIKIDRAFISNITSNEKDRLIAKTIVSLAESMHLKVVAEGIETHEQYNVLKEIHCHRAQGYLFGKPMKPEEYETSFIVENHPFDTL